jgi:CheY-like chemotaxis protein
MSKVKHHILHVEDNQDDALLIELGFRKLRQPCTMTCVEDGAAAIAYLKGEGPYADRERYPLPTLALMDIKIPRYSGLEVLEWIRGQASFRGLPVVIFTSSRNQEDIRRAYDLGVNAYLVKSVELEELQDTLRAVVDFWLNKNVLPF